MQHYMQLNTSHYWTLANVCPDLLCWGLWEVQMQCCHSLLQVFASSGVPSLCSLSLCSFTACNFAYAILFHESCPTFGPLYFSNVSGPAVQDADFSCCLWQPGVTSCLTGFDWQVTCQPDSDHGVCVCMFVDLCEDSAQTLRTANMNFP